MGYNLGDGTNESSNEPICISDIPDNALNGKNIVEVQSGYTMIAIDSEGKVYTWGMNDYGQLGNGTDVEYANEPICISDIPENELYNKKIKFINITITDYFRNIMYTYYSFITENGELYNCYESLGLPN